MTDRELLAQALEALEWVNTSPWLEDCYHAFDKEVAALRERLAQPEMQPCAGRNCGSTNPNLHSAECFEDYEKATGMAQPNEFEPDWDQVEALQESLREHMAEIQRLRAALEQAQEPVAWAYPEGLEALKIGKPWVVYGRRDGNGAYFDGVERIPLYLNDAVARRVEPRLDGSGAGFESLPASPTQQEKNT
jgi:hypothetical protein